MLSNLPVNVRAGLCMMLAMAGFSFNDALIKTLDGVLPSGQVMAVRGALLTLLLLPLLWQRGLLFRMPEAMHRMVLLRAIMEMLATLLFLGALVQLPFANVSAILQALPLAVTVGAALFFGEQVGWRRWMAIGIGFTGVMIIIRPGAAGFNSASLLMIASMLMAACRDLSTRAIPAGIPSLVVTAATALLVAFTGAGLCLFGNSTGNNWQPMSLGQFGVLSAAAGFLFFGYQFIVLAMRTGDVAYVVPFRYTGLLWAVALGYGLFGELPDRYTLIGSAIVVVMGLFTLYLEVLAGRRFRDLSVGGRPVA